MLFQIFFDKDKIVNKNIKSVFCLHVENQEKDTSHHCYSIEHLDKKLRGVVLPWVIKQTV